MTDTMLDMPRKPSKPTGGRKNEGKRPTFPSREKIKYAGIPREYWDMLDAMTADGEEYEGRSVAYLTKLAVRAFLQGKGLLDEKGKPLGKPEG